MIKIFVFLFAILSPSSARPRKTNSQYEDRPYIVPNNIKYPYGDETQFNCNVLDKNTNPFPCEEQKDLEKRLRKCPLDAVNDGTLVTPYIDCPDYAVIPSPDDIALLPDSKPNTEVLCKRCDLKLSADGLAVLLECNHCFDVPSVFRPADYTVKDILYKVFFVQIANYTSVEVTGTEYFNP